MTGTPQDPVLGEDLLPLDSEGRLAIAAAARQAVACRSILEGGLAKPDMRPADLVGRFDGPLP